MRIYGAAKLRKESLPMKRLVCTLKYGRYALGSLTAVLFLACVASS